MSKPDLREIRIRGGQHHRFAEARDKGLLIPRAELILRREPENSYDSRAIAAYVKDPDFGTELKIGYVAAHHASQVYWRLDRGAVVMRCTVSRVDATACDCHLGLQGGWKAPRTSDIKDSQSGDLDDDIPF